MIWSDILESLGNAAIIMSTARTISASSAWASPPQLPPVADSTSERHDTSTGVVSRFNRRRSRKRAGKACATCRIRKVRCDVMLKYHTAADGEITCSNCMLDGIKCFVEESKRGK
jgi:hypothetical protein